MKVKPGANYQKTEADCLMYFAVLTDHSVKIWKKSKKISKHLDFDWKLKKTVKHEDDSNTDCSWCTENGL